MALFPLDRIQDITDHPEEFRLYERVPFTVEGFMQKLPYTIVEQEPEEQTLPLIFLALLTTGSNATQDRILELGLVKCTYSLTRRCLLRIDRLFDGYEDPQCELNEDLQRLGFEASVLQGKKFDDGLITSFFADHPLVIAHGAYRQRPFFDRRFPLLSHEAWACSRSDVEWDKLGFSSAALAYIVQVMNYFYDPTRLCYDGLALAFIFSQYQESLAKMVDDSFVLSYVIEVKGKTFDIKDKLKELGIVYNATKKLACGKCATEEEVSHVLEELSLLPELNMRNVSIFSHSARERFRV